MPQDNSASLDASKSLQAAVKLQSAKILFKKRGLTETTQFCKAIILQLKKKEKEKKVGPDRVRNIEGKLKREVKGLIYVCMRFTSCP